MPDDQNKWTEEYVKTNQKHFEDVYQKDKNIDTNNLNDMQDNDTTKDKNYIPEIKSEIQQESIQDLENMSKEEKLKYLREQRKKKINQDK